MRIALYCALVVSWLTALPALAQNDPNPEQLRKMYDDAVEQLKASQDRKNELATQNEQLTARLAELEKQLAERALEVRKLQQQASQSAERTYYLRVHYAAWQDFVGRWPGLLAKWQLFLDTGAAEPPPGLVPGIAEPATASAP